MDDKRIEQIKAQLKSGYRFYGYESPAFNEDVEYLLSEIDRLTKQAAAGKALHDLVEQIALDCHHRYVTETQAADMLNKALTAYRIDLHK